MVRCCDHYLRIAAADGHGPKVDVAGMSRLINQPLTIRLMAGIKLIFDSLVKRRALLDCISNE